MAGVTLACPSAPQTHRPTTPIRSRVSSAHSSSAHHRRSSSQVPREASPFHVRPTHRRRPSVDSHPAFSFHVASANSAAHSTTASLFIASSRDRLPAASSADSSFFPASRQWSGDIQPSLGSGATGGRKSLNHLRSSHYSSSAPGIITASAGGSETGGQGAAPDDSSSSGGGLGLLSFLPSNPWAGQTASKNNAQQSTAAAAASAPPSMTSGAASAGATSASHQRDSHVCAAASSAVVDPEVAETDTAVANAATPSAATILPSLPAFAFTGAFAAPPASRPTFGLPSVRQRQEWWEVEKLPTNMAQLNVAALRSPEEFESAMFAASMRSGPAAALGGAIAAAPAPAPGKGRLVVVYFFAPWCDACRGVHPLVEEAARANPDVLFLKFNVGDNRELGRALPVKIFPFFHFYRGSPTKLDALCVTARNFPRLEKFITKFNQ